MPILALLLLLAAQPGQTTIDWNPPAAPEPKPQAESDKAVEAGRPAPTLNFGADARTAEERAKALPGAAPATEQERIDAANRAALARAEAARQDAAGAWPQPDRPKMKCRETATGLVCGTSDKAIDEQEQRLKERLDALEQD